MRRVPKALALCAMLLLAASAWAQRKGGAQAESVIELYGKVYPEVVFPRGSGATPTGTATCTLCAPAVGTNRILERNEMESSNSRFGLRGHQRMGENFKAIFQLESGFMLDSNPTSFAQRDSFVGLKHDTFGAVKLGRMDTPFKEYGDDVGFLNVSSGNFVSTSGIFRHIGFGGQNNAARFHERRVNVVQYESAQLGPVDFALQWSTSEGRTAKRNPRVLSMGLRYTMGPVEFLVAHEVHDDLFGLSLNAPAAMRNNTDQSVNSEDQATAIAAKLALGIHRFEVDANRKRYLERTSTPGRVRSYRNSAYQFIWEARWSGQWRTAAEYVKATAGTCEVVAQACDTRGLDGTQIQAGVAYHFSRRTFIFLMVSQVRNGYSAVYNNSNQQEPNPGEDIRQVGLGIHTTF